jgi:hypothetical protein
MLYILAPWAWLIKLFNINNIPFTNFIFKLPILISDFIVFYLLLKIFPDKSKKFFGFIMLPL